MIKRFKRLLVFSVFALVLPMCVKAGDEEYLRFSCEKTQLVPGEKTTCSIGLDVTGTDIVVDGFEGHVRVYENDGTTQTQKLSLGNFTFDSSVWTEPSNSASDGDYILQLAEGDTPRTGSISVGTFELTAGSNAGTAKIGLKNIVFGTSTNEKNVDSAFVQINIVSSTTENTGTNNENTNTGLNTGSNTQTSENTNTNENTSNNSSSSNTADNTKSASDDKKTETKKPVNPDTGVTLSALGIALLVVGGISYIALRKKNYFNRI